MNLNVGDEVEWLTRPLREGGYLRGIVLHIGMKRVKIKLTWVSPHVEIVKWIAPEYLRKVELAESKEG